MTEPIQPPDLSTENDFDGNAFAPLYTTTVTVSGGTASHGRASGRARSDDGILDLDLRLPAELGGDGREPIPSSCSPPGSRPASTAR